MSDELIARLRGHKSGMYFISNTGDRAWRDWMHDLLQDALRAADRIDELERQVDEAAPNKLDNINLCPNCAEKDANIAELIEQLQRAEAEKPNESRSVIRRKALQRGEEPPV